MKQAILAVAVLGLMIRGYFMYQASQVQKARETVQSKGAVDQMRKNMQGSAVDAGEVVPGNEGGHRNATATSAPSVAPAVVAAQNAERAEIEATLRGMHMTTIMPGQPGVFIIDKQDYSEGEDLPLPKNRKARIVRVQDDGVLLTCNGTAYHLDPPSEPDLAALRKKK